MFASSRIAIVFAVLALAAADLRAEKRTVCTITVNSSDEKEAFGRYLPKGDYQFVELVEKGRTDWLASSCKKRISCDVLVVSGHFNAGETFYSDKIDNNDYLRVDELERASCSDSCPALFSQLKEVYLFGCESLNPDATRYSSSYGESGRDRMRRIFPNVPVIYGFSSAAPVGAAAAGLISRYLSSGTAEIGSGHASSRLLAVFGRTSMTAVSGSRDSGRSAAHRPEVCQFFDERLSPAGRIAFIHGLLRRDASELRSFFDRIERTLAALTNEEKVSEPFMQAIDAIAADRDARDRYLAYARGVDRADLRARLLNVAATLGWLDPAQHRAQIVQMVNDLLARPIGFSEVDLVCSLNQDRQLDQDLARVRSVSPGSASVGQDALLGCMGSADANGRVLQALASPDDRDVQIAQAYLRQRPISDSRQLRGVAARIARMGGSGAQVRALDTLARLNISDREILDELTQAFATTRSINVQRSIAEVFIRSDPKGLPGVELASVLRQHRLRSPERGEDIIDVLIRRLSS